MSKQNEPSSNRHLTSDTVFAAFEHELHGPRGDKVVRFFVFLNLFLFLARPHNDIPALAELRIPLILSFIPALFWIPRHTKTWSTITRAMLALLVVGAIWVPFARNNRWAFNTLVDLTQQFFLYCFPIIVFLAYGTSLRTLSYVLTIIGAYLGLYVALHNGHGPGWFLGDENDVCFALLTLLPIPLSLVGAEKNFFRRLLSLAAIFLVLWGIVSTSSRGGFVGLVIAGSYFAWKAPSKKLVFLIAMVAALGAFFVPNEYWEEMRTISETSSGTAQARRAIWGIAFRVWTDPRHTIAGVGMENTPRWLRDYEPAEDFFPEGRSVSGRAIHSLYFQLLGDLGLIGLTIFVLVIGTSFRGNNAVTRETKQLMASLSAPAPSARGQYLRLRSHIYFLQALSLGLNTALMATLGSGIFISVLYYPPLWLIASISVTLQNHWKNINALLHHPTPRAAPPKT